ncbi:FUSC family protein [Streptomyces sp. NPDC001380]|uniref:FUSC family protein n=1 Tax=Streptomyces sp. NPDC001380 TaxID=3364566 RepID=UPI0036CC0587
MGRVRQACTGLRDRFTASDPGLIRLLAALQTIGTIVLSLAVLAALHAPVMLLVVTAVTGLATSFAVTGPRLRDQAATLALGLPAALLSVTLAALLLSHRVAADLVFVALIFAAVYVRRYGPRGSGPGIIAFQLYFVAQFVQVGPAQLPALYGAVTAAFAAAAVMRFGLLRVTPERTLDRLRRAFRVRLGRVLGAQAELVAEARTGTPPAERDVGELHRSIARLHACALMIQGRLETGTADACAASLVQRRIAEAEIGAERLGVLLLRALEPGGGGADHTLVLHLPDHLASPAAARPLPHPPDADAAALGTLERELRALRLLAGRTAEERQGTGHAAVRNRLLGYRDDVRLPQDASPPVQDAFRAVGELSRAVLGLNLALAEDAEDPADDSPETVRSREELEAEDVSLSAAEEAEAAEEEPRGLDRPSTRAAFQVSAGSALAMLGGELLSPQRWYWAVLTCWVVFVNTSSTGEILVKGSRRLFGTAVGVVAGLALAVPLGGEPWPAFALVVVCIFGTSFTAPLSQTLMSFFVTLMLALLYTLLHTFSAAVLVLRIEETALGAACGLAAALLVLPVRTRRRTDEQLREVLERLDDVLTASAARLGGTARPPGAPGGGLPDGDLLDLARALDTALDGLRASVMPLTHPVSPLRTRRRNARYVMGLLETCAYHARSLAATAEQVPGQLRIGADPRLAGAAGRISRNLRALARRMEGTGGRPPALESGPNVAAALGPQAGGTVALRVLRHLQRLDEGVLGLARPLGCTTAPEDAAAGARPGRPPQDVPA